MRLNIITVLCGWIKSKKTILLLLLILAVGSFLRIYGIGAQNITYEEAVSLNVSTQGIASVIEEIGNQIVVPLYFIVLHFWIKLFGISEAAVRSLSAIFGIVSILLIYQIGSILFSRRVGLIGSFLSAISFYYIAFSSQFARPYGLLLLLSLLSYLLFIKILKEDRKWYYPAYFLVNLLLGYTHLYGLFVIASQMFFFLLFWNKYRLQRLKFSITVVVTVTSFLPIVFLLGGQVITGATSDLWWPEMNLKSIIDTLAGYAGAEPGRPFLLLVFLLLVIFGSFSIKLVAGKWSWKKPVESLNDLRWQIKLESIEKELLLVIWLSISIIIPFIESRFWTSVYLPKYIIGASPALYLLVAKGLANLPRKWLFYSVLTLIILLSSLGLYNYYESEPKTQWKEAANLVELNSAENDVILFCGPVYQLPFDYYYQGDLPEFRIGTRADAQKVATFVDSVTQGKDRLWLILHQDCQSALISSYLIDRYSRQSIILEEELFRVEVLLFDLP